MTAFFYRLWNFRFIRWGIWFLVTLLTLDALVCGYVNWTGTRRWAAAKAMLEANGETLDFNQLLPHHIDDAQNFCAIEPLLGINIADGDQSPLARKRAVLEKASWPFPGKLDPPPLHGGPSQGMRPDLHAWAVFVSGTKYLNLPAASANEANEILVAMDTAYPVLKQLADAAVARQGATFEPVPIPSRPLFATPLPHYDPVRKASQALTLRALAANESGDTAAACASSQAVLHLVEATQHEPFLIAQLVAGVLDSMAVESVWVILEKRQASELQVQALQTSLGRIDFHQGTLTAMRGELAAAIDSLECVQTGAYRLSDLNRQMAFADGRNSEPMFMRLLSGLLPMGLIDHNKAVIAGMDYQYCIAPLKKSNGFDWLGVGSSLDEETNSHRGWLYPDHVIANLTVPSMTKVFARMCQSEAIRRQALTACAVERYYLVHHAYPEHLSDLLAAPGFLEAVPLDPVDNQPLRYRQTADGRYVLWSVGFDRQDDGGRVIIPPGETPATTKLYKQGYKGDWVWQYQPVK